VCENTQMRDSVWEYMDGEDCVEFMEEGKCVEIIDKEACEEYMEEEGGCMDICMWEMWKRECRNI
jgi:hypothetical protein